MKRIIYIFLFLLIYTEGGAQNALNKQASLVLNLPNDTTKIRQLYTFAQAYYNENLATELSYYQKAYALALNLKAVIWLPTLESRMGRNFGYMGQSDSSLFYFNLAKQRLEAQQKPTALASLYLLMRTQYRVMGKYNTALEYAHKALLIYQKEHDEVGVERANRDIADVLSLQDANADALKYIQKAYAFFKQRGQVSEDYALCCRTMGDISLQLAGDTGSIERNRPSLNYQIEGVAIARQLGDKLLLVRTLRGYGNSLIYMEQQEAANKVYQEALNLSSQLNATVFQYSFIVNVCDYYKKQGKYREAIDLSLHLVQYLKSTNSHFNLADAYAGLANTYKEIGKADSVMYYMHLREVDRDSFVSKESRELQAQYETAHKEAKIADQANEIDKQQTRFWTALAFLALALIGGTFLYWLTQQLRQRNEEKEFLIKEIHHRVKNNLQVLSSLLHLQSKHIKDENALEAVREGQNRVEAMGLIHQKLYMGDNLAAVDMQDYLQNLGDTLLDSFGYDDDSVQIKYEVQPLHLDVDTAIPLGLVINELVTNSLKYAFPLSFRRNTEGGILILSLWINEAKKLCLKVADNGVGNSQPSKSSKLLEGYHKNSTSFGTNLVQILSKKLKGKIEVLDVPKGYATLIQFEEYKVVKI